MIFSFIRVEICKLSEGHVNRIERLILELRHPNGSLTNSYKGMAELLKTALLCFYREDEGSIPHSNYAWLTLSLLSRMSDAPRTTLTLIRVLALIGFSLRL